jgi:hypothetical protein
VPTLNIAIAPVADEIRTHFWSHEPYRHFEFDIIVSNNGPTQADNLSFEILFPEEAVADYDGSRWRPSHKHTIEGTTYLVWSTAGAYGTGHVAGGMSLTPSPEIRWRQTLAVNVKPTVKSALILYRLFEKGDPLTEWISQDIEFTSLSPRF